jgi:peroxiredoxin
MKLLLLGLLLLPGLVAAQQPFPYILSGQLGPLPATATLYLSHNGQLLDSTRLRDGRFTFRGTSQQPKRVQLLLAPNGVLPAAFRMTNKYPDDFRELFLESTPIVLTSQSGLRHAKITAGPINKDDQLFNAQWQALTDQLYGKWHPGDGVRLVTLSSYQRERPFYKRLITKFIQEHPASWISLDLLERRRLGPAQYDEVAPLYAALSPALRSSAAGHAYGQLVDSLRAVALAAIAPDLTLTTPAGKRVAVRDYRGQYVLLLFWSSQCECGFELRPTVEVCRRYLGHPLAVLSVSLDDQLHRKLWVRALTDYQMPGTPASDLEGPAGHAAQRYHIDSPLQNFLLDPTGHIIAVNLYGEELAAALTKLPSAPSKP